MTEARPTSEPVPEVVGTAMMGAMPASLTRVKPIFPVLKIPDWPGLSDHQRDRFTSVQSTAATEGDDTVVSAIAKAFHPGRDIRLNGISPHIREQATPQPCVTAAGYRVVDHLQSSQPGVGNH